jgi:ATP-dependent DNA helicase DinG
MRCPKCGLELPHAAKLNTCTICGIPLVYDVQDVFDDRLNGIVREIRPGQTRMAKTIDAHLRTPEQTFLLLEGGTGIGKSFAYLVPSILQRNEQLRGTLAADVLKDFEEKTIIDANLKQKIVIATTKKVLQKQICYDDLRDNLMPKLNASSYVSEVILKSQSNYACTDPSVISTLKNAMDRENLMAFIRRCSAQGLYPESDAWDGDKPVWWDEISVDNCPFAPKMDACPRRSTCCPDITRSNFLVSNQALVSTLFANNLFTSRTKFGECKILIVDEAHMLVNSLYNAHTRKLTFKGLNSLLKKVLYHPFIDTGWNRGIVSPHVEDAVTGFKKLHDLCHKWGKESKSAGGVLKSVGFHCSFLEADILAEQARIVESLEEVRGLVGGKIGTSGDDGEYDDQDEVFKGGVLGSKVNKNRERSAHRLKLKRHYDNIGNFSNNLQTAFKTFETRLIAGAVPVVTEDGIEIIPEDISQIAAEHFKGVNKVVFLSATMCVGGTFDYIRRQFGLDLVPGAKIVEEVFESPFDYNKQAVIYLPIHMDTIPEYGSSPALKNVWFRQMAEEIAFMVEAFQGDALILFTAQYEMDAIFEMVKEIAGVWSNVTYIKMEKGRGEYFLDKYMATDKAALFGMKSYWEGIDIPGDKLRLVVIAKLPFPMQSDPTIALETQRAKAAGSNDFNTVQIPRMLFDLRQGAGRLIRRKTDVGIVAVLDARMWTGGGKDSVQKLQRLRKLKEAGQPISPMGYGLRAFNAIGFKNRIDTREKFLKVLEKINNRPGLQGNEKEE